MPPMFMWQKHNMRAGQRKGEMQELQIIQKVMKVLAAPRWYRISS